MPIIVCENCGKDFEVQPYRVKEGAKYCTPECSYAARAPKPKTCEWCGREYTGQNKQFCSKSCLGESLKERVDYTCQTCGESFESTPRANRKFCSRECWAESRKGVSYTPQKRIYLDCETCGKRFWRWPSHAAISRFCSRSCSNEWKRTITGEDHPLYKPPAVLTCEWCGSEYETKPSLAARGSRFCSANCVGAWVSHNSSRKRTKIELAVASWLTELGVEYIAEKPMGKFVCDFVIKSARLVIECDGVYWHSLPRVKRRDKRKDRWLKAHGYSVLRLRGDKIRNHPRWCIKQIANHLQGHLL